VTVIGQEYAGCVCSLKRNKNKERNKNKRVGMYKKTVVENQRILAARESYRAYLLRHIAPLGVVAGVALTPFFATSARAASVQLGDVTVTLQSTLDYTLGVRTAPVNNTYLNVNGLNSDDGDRNFSNGVMANRIQTLEQLNIQDGNYGLRASALAYLDTVYLGQSKNSSPDTFNSYGIGPRSFTSETIANEGRKIEPLALFVYGSEFLDGGASKLSWQIGRQTITWGETLFSFDGIAGLQAPADFYQAQLLPNPQAQALFLPTGAARLSYQFANGLTLDGYWQFEYEADELPGVGSYFSASDAVGPGGQRILFSPINEGAAGLYRGPDVRPNNGLDQFGLSAHDNFGNFGAGIYFVQGIPKGPNVYTNVTGANTPTSTGVSEGVYNIVYAKPVDAFGASISTLIGSANVAAEFSDRINQPLISDPQYTTTANYNDPLYAEGNVVNLTANGIYLTPPLPIFTNGIAISTELTLNDVTSVNRHAENLVAGNTSEGGQYELVATPNWFPTSSLEVEIPIGWSTTFLGDSQYDGSAAGTSTYDIGLEGIYKNNLSFGMNYQRYAGPPNRESNLDRDFVTFYVQRTF
jgi:hypothetical protein